jgi:RNA polymerase-binding transcription factor DksA
MSDMKDKLNKAKDKVSETASTVGHKISEAATATGHKIKEAATATGHKISETAEKVTDWAKEKLQKGKNRTDEAAQKVEHAATQTFGSSETCGADRGTANIQEHMEVIGSDGSKVGTVDHVEGSMIKLTRHDSPDGQHHFLPLDWVARVDTHVHLNKARQAAQEEWQSAGA